jgi:hypothetical protein
LKVFQNNMNKPRQVEFKDVERREFQLTMFVCSVIASLAAGLALLMYPAVFAAQNLSPNRTAQVAFFGFCGLSGLLVIYILDRQFMIRGLRHQIAVDRERATEALQQASADLLTTMPNFSTFEDRLSMEFRRAQATDQTFSVLVVGVKLDPRFSEPNLATSIHGDAARIISRQFRGQDSVYLLKHGFFGVILPGMDTSAVRRASSHLSEELSYAASPDGRFHFEIDTINFPEQATSAYDLKLAVTQCLPEDEPTQERMKETHPPR